MMDTKGYDRLWGWFGISRASFCVMPRVLMHEMPDAWQFKMAKLLEEYDAAYPNQPDVTCRVQIARSNGRLMRTPEWMINYRRPDRETIQELRVEALKK